MDIDDSVNEIGRVAFVSPRKSCSASCRRRRFTALERQRLQFRHPRLTEVHESAQSSSGRLTVQLPRIGQPGETLRASR